MRGKILVLTGDPETLVHQRGELLRAFARAGMEVVAVAGQDLTHVRGYLYSIGCSYRALKIERNGLNPFSDFQAILAIWRLLKSEKPDYIFSYTIKPVIYGSVVARLCGVPNIYALIPGLGYAFTPDGGWKQRLIGAASALLYSAALRCVDKVFLQNYDDERYLRDRRILPKSVPSCVTRGSGVDLGQFPSRDLRADADLLARRVRFVLVSRLLRKKGIAEYVEAAKLLKQRNTGIEFDLVGPLDPSPDGFSAAEVRAWEKEGLIQYHGPTRDVSSYLSRAHVFVLPTYYREGVPRCILEALSTGLPIVTTDSVGSRETVRLTRTGELERAQGATVMQGENGVLVRPRDPRALAEALQQLLNDPARLAVMGRASRALAESEFDVRQVNAVILREMGFTSESVEDRLPPLEDRHAA